MRKKNKLIGVTISLFAIGVILHFLWIHLGGDISNVTRRIGTSKVYSKQDIEHAMNTVEREFKIDFGGCTLMDLWYDEEISILSANEWANQYEADEAIILVSNFKVDSSGGDGSLNPNDTYTNWQWILVRKEGSSSWILKTWGYG